VFEILLPSDRVTWVKEGTWSRKVDWFG
jgi:hypothetical protein